MSTAAGVGRRSRANARRKERGIRRWQDALWMVAGLVILALCSLAANADTVSALERDVFRAVNDTVTVPFFLAWSVMQLGNIVAVPATAVFAALFGHFRLAASILIGGAGTYVLAKVVKHIVVRGRPSVFLDGVNIRGATPRGLGYVSGHAGVVAVIATVAFPYLGTRGRWIVGTLAVLVCLLRMYVGAHLPLDMVGGAALGVAVGGAVRLLMGRPVRSRSSVA